MKEGDLVYLTEDYINGMDGEIAKGEYELRSDPMEGGDGKYVIIFDWTIGNTIVPIDLIITLEEKIRKERNKKLESLLWK